ncbi:MAG: hypothetical protein ACRC28_12955 [Clostridium sp.]|uniref:hypothetical protein n=1 Tax=Clostridium sp. TaxID=1506 RepID=UPI003F345989
MKKFIIGIIIFLAVALLGIFAVYEISFKPEVPVTPINSTISLTEWNLTKKFLPKDIDLSLSQLSATSDTNFSSGELTELFIAVVQKNPELSKYVTGLSVKVNSNNTIDLYVNLVYKNIPVQAHLLFSCIAVNGQGILHYTSGNVGFISIPKELLFKYAENNDIFQFNKSEGDIILSFPSIKYLDVQALSTSDDTLNIKFNLTVRFWDWLKKN